MPVHGTMVGGMEIIDSTLHLYEKIILVASREMWECSLYIYQGSYNNLFEVLPDCCDQSAALALTLLLLTGTSRL